MARFCEKCGTPLPENSAFCPTCGAPASPQPPAQPYPQTPPQQAPAAVYSPQPPQYTAPAPSGYPPAQLAETARSSNTLIKVVLSIVVILAVLGIAVAGGLWYVGHKVVSTVKDAAAQAGINTDDIGRQAATPVGDPCRFLSKSDVSDAIGVTITETTSSPDGCVYLAHGTLTDLTSQHLSAMAGQRGAPKDAQKMIQQFAGIIGAPKDDAAAKDQTDAAGNAPVLAVNFQTQSARTQIQLESKVLGGLGGAGGGNATLTGIGDEAYVAADGMLMVRKGDTMVRFMYTSCPCTTDAIKPLAKKLADQL
jgi:hypothetical protein